MGIVRLEIQGHCLEINESNIETVIIGHETDVVKNENERWIEHQFTGDSTLLIRFRRGTAARWAD